MSTREVRSENPLDASSVSGFSKLFGDERRHLRRDGSPHAGPDLIAVIEIRIADVWRAHPIGEVGVL